MALKLDYTDANTGVLLTDAHVKVDEITGGDKNKIFFYVKIWKNKTAKQDGKDPVIRLHYKLSPHDGLGNLWTQMYDYLKTLPEFAGAEDDV